MNTKQVSDITLSQLLAVAERSLPEMVHTMGEVGFGIIKDGVDMNKPTLYQNIEFACMLVDAFDSLNMPIDESVRKRLSDMLSDNKLSQMIVAQKPTLADKLNTLISDYSKLRDLALDEYKKHQGLPQQYVCNTEYVEKAMFVKKLENLLK